MTEVRAGSPRQTVGVLAAASALLLALQLYQRHQTAAIGAAIVLLLLASTALSHRASSRIHRAWMSLARALGYVNSRVLLGLSFFLILVPTGLLMQLSGRDTLRVKPHQGSGWTPRRSRAQTRSAFERAF